MYWGRGGRPQHGCEGEGCLPPCALALLPPSSQIQLFCACPSLWEIPLALPQTDFPCIFLSCLKIGSPVRSEVSCPRRSAGLYFSRNQSGSAVFISCCVGLCWSLLLLSPLWVYKVIWRVHRRVFKKKKVRIFQKFKMSRFCDPADSFRGNQVLHGRGKTSDEQLQYRRANDVSFIWK